MSRSSHPPMRTVPSVGSQKRATSRQTVDLPEPLGPTRAVTLPCGMRTSTPSSTRRAFASSEYAKDTSVNDTSAEAGSSAAPVAGSLNASIASTLVNTHFDIVGCPYQRVTAELGVPEICNLFCTNDDIIYGDLPGIRFSRSGTLGRGDAVCDFDVSLTKEAAK